MTEKHDEPLFTEEDMSVTQDLVNKIGHDVVDLIGRTLKISPPPQLPIIIGAGVSVIGCLSYYLESRAGVDPDVPDKKSVLLSALLVAYTMIHKDTSKISQAAMDATDLLIKEGMI